MRVKTMLLPGLAVVAVAGAFIGHRPGTGAARGPAAPIRIADSAYDKGPAARFCYPAGVAVDAGGTVYVADPGSHTIRKISPAGQVSTLAGKAGEMNVDSLTNGPGPTARFNHPHGVAVDAAGTVYVAEASKHIIRKITPSGVVSLLAGSWDRDGSKDGIGAAARFYRPSGIAVDAAGTVYVADSGNDAIRKITPAGVVSTLAGGAHSLGFPEGPEKDGFDGPAAIAVDAAGMVYVADEGSNRILKITPAGVVRTLAGLASEAEIAVAGGSVFGSADGAATKARFYWPTGIAVDAAGTVYVVDRGNNAIRRVSPAGEVSTLAGSAHTGGSRNGRGTAVRFSDPYGVAIDAAGTLYVADAGNSCIRKISPQGAVSTLAGSEPGDCEETPVVKPHRH